MSDVVVPDCAAVEERDLVSLYVGERLGGPEAEAFERHYFGCERCWGDVQRATEVRAALSPAARPGRRTARASRVLAYAAAIALALLIPLALLRVFKTRSSPDPFASLLANAPAETTLEARLAGLPFRPSEVSRETSISRERDPRYRKLVVALDEQEKEFARHPTADGARAVALAHLLLGDTDLAVQALEKASTRFPEDGKVENDLSAARFMQAQQLKRTGQTETAISELIASRNAADRALQVAPDLKEAKFNRALALTALVDFGRAAHSDAAKAWDEYLAADPGSPWAAEARKRRDALPSAPVSRLWDRVRGEIESASDASDLREQVRAFPQNARSWAEDEILLDWATAVRAGRAEAARRNLTLARRIGRALAESSGERLLSDAVVLIDNAHDRAALEPLASGHADYGEARSLYRRRAIRDAIRRFQRARTAFHVAGSPFESLAALSLGSCHFYENALPAALEETTRVESVAGTKRDRYLALFGQTFWLRGLIQGQIGDPGNALASYEQALAILERANESENAAFVHALLAQLYSYLGDSDRAWRHRSSGLAILTRLGSPERLHNALGEASAAALGSGDPRLALGFADDAVSVSARIEDAAYLVDALLWRADALRATGEASASAQALAKAAEARSRIREPGTARRMSALVDLRLAEAAPDRAPELLSSAVSFFRSSRNHALVARAFLLRGRAWLRRSSLDLAERDFRRGLSELERQRTRIPEESLRISYFESARSLYDEEVRLLIDQGRTREAFRFADACKARSLRDSLSRRLPRAVAFRADLPETVAQRLPRDTTLVEYYALDDRLAMWAIDQHGYSYSESRVSAVRLGEQVDDAVRGLRNPRQSIEGTHVLGRLVLDPVAAAIQRASRLVIVPDGPLHRVAFSALPEPGTGTFLVERHEISVMPAASFPVGGRGPADTLGNSALIVADPVVDPARFGGLPALPNAREEGRRVADVLSGSEILQGRDATREQVLRRMRSHPIVHFACHTMVNAREPEHSALLLSSRGSDPGILTSEELESLAIGRARLAFLSACQTAAGAQRSVDGNLSIARAFLTAGFPEVVASLWPVEDGSAAMLADLFYRELSKPLRPPAALRAAQLAMMARANSFGRSPVTWANYVVIALHPS